MCVAEWARRMPCAARGVDAGGDRRALLQHALAQDGRRAAMKPPSFCVSITSKRKPSADELAGVADLAAALAVERRLIEHDGDRLLVADFVDLVAQLVLGDDAHDLAPSASIVS